MANTKEKWEATRSKRHVCLFYLLLHFYVIKMVSILLLLSLSFCKCLHFLREYTCDTTSKCAVAFHIPR